MLVETKMISEFYAEMLLDKYFSDKSAFKAVLSHSLAVRDAAISIANDIIKNSKVSVDLDLVRIGALLHDIGRSKYPPGHGKILHGIEGYRILMNERLPKIALFARNHVGFGIYDYDIKLQHLPLPSGNYVPETIEQKIVSYADNLIFGSRRGDFLKVLKRFFNEISFFILKRAIDSHNEIASLSGKKMLIPDPKFIESLFDPVKIIKRINSSEFITEHLPYNKSNICLCLDDTKINLVFEKRKMLSISSCQGNCDLFLKGDDLTYMYENTTSFLKDWNSFYSWLSLHKLSEKTQKIIKPFFDYPILFI